MKCAYCETEMEPVQHRVRLRRGDRDATASGEALRCATGCLGEADEPFEVVTLKMAAANDDMLKKAWLKKYGEPVPARGRSGRPRRAVRRTEMLGVPLTPAELAEVDERRGAESRASFVRALLQLGGPRKLA